MKKDNVDFDGLQFDSRIRSLPKVPASQATKDRILKNVLKTKNDRRRRVENTLEILKPIAFAAVFMFMIVSILTNYQLEPLNAIDGFYLDIETNVADAKIYFAGEELGQGAVIDKISSSGEILVVKEGYTQWRGTFLSDNVDRAIDTFRSSGNYELFKASNTMKVVVELEPINGAIIQLETEVPGATVLVNGRYAGETPLELNLRARDNFVEVIQKNKEKVSINLIYDGSIDVVGDRTMKFSDQGYYLEIESDPLFFPQSGIWINEEEYLLLEALENDYRAKLINSLTQEMIIVEKEFLNYYLDAHMDGFLLNNKVYDAEKNTLSYIIGEGRVTAEGGKIMLDDGTPTVLIETGEGAFLTGVHDNNLYYQEDEKLYLHNVSNKTTHTVLDTLDGKVELMEFSEKGLFLLIDGKLYLYSEGNLDRIVESLDTILHFSINEGEMLIFSLDNYVNIFKLDLEKESIEKIY